jgi:poly(3-hydroxybutyrate) depolymerase
MRTSFVARSTALSTVLTVACVALGCGSKEAEGPSGGAGAAQSGSGGTSAGSAGMSPGSGGASGTAPGSGGAGGASANGGAAGSGTSGGSAGSAASAGAAAGGSAGSGAGSGGSGGAPSSGAGGGGGMGQGGSAGMPAGGDAGSGASGGGGLQDPKPSKGCRSTPVAAPMSGMASIDVGGTARDYIIRIPAGYDGTAPMRIIFAFHGASGSAVQVDNGDPPNSGLEPTGPYYGIKEHADDHTIFVAGQANGTWNDKDVDYVKALVAKFEDELCLDESRILATGFSMGGIMTLRVACNMYDVFRAVAPMSCSLSASNCPAGGDHIAYWSSHGEQDTTINISNGEAARDEFAKRNGCSTDSMPIGNDGCVAYQGCDDGYPVNWCPFMGIHQPPPFSGPEIWAFLSQF